MEGHETFLLAVDKLSQSTREVLELAELALEDVDLFVYHQANSRILAAVAERLELPRERVFDCIAELWQHERRERAARPRRGRARRRACAGRRVVLGAVGAGLVWGATVLTWGRLVSVAAERAWQGARS